MKRVFFGGGKAMKHSDPIGQLDDPGRPDRDLGFLGFRSRPSAQSLPPGLVRYVENMRCDENSYRVRKGPVALATDLSLSQPPLVLDFYLGDGAGTPYDAVYETYDDEVRAAGAYSTDDNAEGVILVTTDRAFAYREGESTAEIAYPGGQDVEAGDPVWLEQAGGYVYLFRGDSKYVMRWDRDVATDFVRVSNGAHPNGGTFTYMPNCDWGVLWNTQLVIPAGRSEFNRSGFREYETFNTAFDQQRIKVGGNDWLMFAHSFQRQRLLVFYRKSVHIARYSFETVAPDSIDEVTQQAGLVARGTVAECGDLVVFLSDSGLRVLRVLNDLEVVMAPMPLSEPIDDLLQGMNWAYAAGCVGIYFNNRYYFAYPSAGSVVNDRVAVFNFMNRSSSNPDDSGFYGEWESVDVFQGSFDVKTWLILDYAGRKRLHAATTYGFIFLMEEGEVDEYGLTAVIGEYAIPGKLHSRHFLADNSERKRILRVGVELEAYAAADAVEVTVGARNPDASRLVESYVATAAGDATVNRRVRGLKGTQARVDIETSAGRPEVKSIELEASDPGGRRETTE